MMQRDVSSAHHPELEDLLHEDDTSLRPMCPVARRILDEVVMRQRWESRQRSRATCPPRVRYDAD